MTNPAPSARLHMRRCIAPGAVLALLLGAVPAAHAQGLVKGVQDGAAAGNKAAGPVGGVLGGAIGGVVGVFTGVLGVGNNNGNQAPAAKETSKDAGKDAKQQGAAKDKEVKDKDAKSAKAGKGAKASKEAKNAPQGKDNKEIAVLTQPGAPQQTAEQIVANSDAYIERIKTELNLTPEQEKHWYGFSSAMHYLGHNGAERLNLRIARAKRDPPDDIIEQMRNESQFLIDRAADQRNVADAAEPLYSSLDDKQKQVFIQEMVRLSHERGLD
jgi:hypothetical protein